jgi:peroxiredoxin
MTDNEGSERSMTEGTTPLRPGDRAPDVALPAVTREGTLSLAEYRERNPVLLALFRGLY